MDSPAISDSDGEDSYTMSQHDEDEDYPTSPVDDEDQSAAEEEVAERKGSKQKASKQKVSEQKATKQKNIKHRAVKHRAVKQRVVRQREVKQRDAKKKAASTEEEFDVSNVPITELLHRKRRRNGMKAMPSSVKRLEERKRQRMALRKQKEQELSESNSQPQSVHSSVKKDEGKIENAPSEIANNDTSTSAVTANNNQDEGPAMADDDDEEEEVVAPQVTIDENGEIIIDKDSLFVQSKSAAEGDPFTGLVSTVENGPLGNRISSASFKKREMSSKWTKDENDRFFEALGTFGTDFSLMIQIFPNRSRKQLKHKFKREEREQPERIDRALNGPRRPIPAILPIPKLKANVKDGKQLESTLPATEDSKDSKESKVESNEKKTSKANEDEDNDDNDEIENTGGKQNVLPEASKATGGGGGEIVGRVSDDEEDMLATYEDPGEDYEVDDGYDDMDDDD